MLSAELDACAPLFACLTCLLPLEVRSERRELIDPTTETPPVAFNKDWDVILAIPVNLGRRWVAADGQARSRR